MNLNTVYNACMSKMASMEMGGMYKSAGPNDGSQSAQVGKVYPHNTYAEQLTRNAQARKKQLLEQARNTPDPRHPDSSPEFREAGMKITLDSPFMYDDHSRFYDDRYLMGNPSVGSIITQAQLDKFRDSAATAQAVGMFDVGTNQYDAARQYLIERGKENQQRYNDGTLWKNEPTKVPMPKVISKPEDVTALDYAGYNMANNNRSSNTSKMASIGMGGMYKSAGPNDGSQSAQVGVVSADNQYAAQLTDNALARQRQLLHQARTTPDPRHPESTPDMRDKATFDNLRRVYSPSRTRFEPKWNILLPRSPNAVITQRDLDLYRDAIAGSQAGFIFDRRTDQFDAARQYLIERGKENQQRYKDGTLWKNEPSKVPMPKVISKPEDVQALDYAGYTMASNNQPRNQNIGYA